MKARIIPLVLVPIFALAACSSNQDPQQVATPTDADKVVYNSDGSMSQHPLLTQYEEAKAQGYTGDINQFAALMQMYQTNPEQAQQVAADSGFSGGEMLLGALAGAAVGAMAANAMSSKSNMASSTYSAQRTNGSTNYAYSQPLSKEEEDRRRQMGSGGTYIPPSNSGSTASRATSTSSSNTFKSLNSTPTTTTRPSTPSVSSGSSRASTATSVSRGGFGGAVSSGG